MFLQKAGQRLNKLYDMIDMVIDSQTLRIQTGVLNEIMMEAVAMQQPPSDKGKPSETLLYHPGIGKTTDLCNLCK